WMRCSRAAAYPRIGGNAHFDSTIASRMKMTSVQNDTPALMPKMLGASPASDAIAIRFRVIRRLVVSVPRQYAAVDRAGRDSAAPGTVPQFGIRNAITRPNSAAPSISAARMIAAGWMLAAISG